MRLPALSLLFPLSCCAIAQDAAPHRVEVSAPSGQAQRREASVARIVVGRDDIARYGDGNLGEILKRQPGVTLVGSEVRMRGLGAGYTQLLIDGEPAPQGFSIDALSPELVERIEISRSASADQSTQAVAGSINIILRKRARDLRREDKAAAGYQHGAWSPSASTQFNGRGKLLAWSVNAALDRAAVVDEIRTDSFVDAAGVAPLALRRADYRGRAHTERFNLAPRLNWEFQDGDTLAWQNLIGAARSRSANRTLETALFGPGTLYPDNDAAFSARNDNLRSDLAWSHRVPGAGKLTVKGLFDVNRRRSDYVFRGLRPGAQPGLVRSVEAGIRERTLGVNGKYLLPLGAAHSLGLGWDAGRTTRGEFRNQRDAGADSLGQAPRLQDYTATVDRLALFAQDEWDIAASLQAYVGIRWEGLRTATVGRDMDRMQGSSRVASPIAQLLWKLEGRQQLRLALARTYKAPPTRDLVPRRYTINNDNSAVNPDAEGNPALRPELSWGLDLAYERYFARDGVAAVSAYLRRVSDVTAQQLYRDGASWVARPVNDGRAQVAGIEFDLRTPLALGPLRVEVRFNASRNWSQLERVPGPDNRLAGQVPVTANAGLDYRSGGAWAAGVNLGFQGGARSRTASGVLDYRGARALADVYWTRKVGSDWRLRVSAANALGRTLVTGTSYRGPDGASRRDAVGKGAATLRFAVERSL